MGREDDTRQIWLKVDSTLVSVTSNEITSAITPAMVNCPALSVKRAMYFSTELAAVGTKLEKM